MDFKVCVTPPADLFKTRAPDFDSSEKEYGVDAFGTVAAGPTLVVKDPAGKLLDTAIVRIDSKGRMLLVRLSKSKPDEPKPDKKKPESPKPGEKT